MAAEAGSGATAVHVDPPDLVARVEELSAIPAGEPLPSDADHVIFRVLDALESGDVRAARKDEHGTWRAVHWVKRGILLGTLEKAVNWSRKQSMWPATFGLACCAIEMMATGAANYDLSRWGMEVFRASPRQADLMIVAGRVSQKMAPVLRQIYDQMPEPKWVISMGVCASSGGMFTNYALVQGVDTIVPVDVYVPGCPPRPEMLMFGILKLQEKVRTQGHLK